jgi:hypothetical protein
MMITGAAVARTWTRALRGPVREGAGDGGATVPRSRRRGHPQNEDWPRVLANLRHAARPGGVLYLTVEERDQADIDRAFESLSARGLPAARGEVVEGDVAGYHYYPGRAQVLEWFGRESLTVADAGRPPGLHRGRIRCALGRRGGAHLGHGRRLHRDRRRGRAPLALFEPEADA